MENHGDTPSILIAYEFGNKPLPNGEIIIHYNSFRPYNNPYKNLNNKSFFLCNNSPNKMN